MKRTLSLLMLFSSFCSFAQYSKSASGVGYERMPASSHVDSVYRFADESALPKDGMENFLKFITDNVTYPQAALDSGISGRVAYQFIVEKNGTISHVLLLKEIGDGCGKVVEKAIKAYPGSWLPAKIDGQPVRSFYTGTFKFVLNDSTDNVWKEKSRQPNDSAVPFCGYEAFQTYVEQQTIKSIGASSKDLNGTVRYQLAIDSTGKIQDIKILKGIDDDYNKAVILAIASCPYRWKPAVDAQMHPINSVVTGIVDFDSSLEKGNRRSKMLEFVDQEAKPAGGVDAFTNYFAEHVIYPEEAIRAGVYGRVVYKFEVDTNGAISNVKILKAPGFGLGDAVKKALERYHTHWIPATSGGHPVKSYYTGTFNFQLH